MGYSLIEDIWMIVHDMQKSKLKHRHGMRKKTASLDTKWHCAYNQTN